MQPKFSKSQIGKTGKRLRKHAEDTDDLEKKRNLEILVFWRSQHSIPLSKAFSELSLVSKNINKNAILAHREKRAKSIIDKLVREKTMNLTTMQDIGGCRAIVTTPKDVLKISRNLRKKKHISLINNYIDSPKPDGYRGVHLTGQYDSRYFEGLSIEFQIRTKIQHSWATAGEITELFSSKSIKNLYGDPEWKAFYKLVADCFSIIDQKYITRDLDFEHLDVNDLSSLLKKRQTDDYRKWAKNIVKSSNKLKIKEKFKIYQKSLQVSDSYLNDKFEYAVLHGLGLSSAAPRVKVYKCKNMDEARSKNFAIEQAIEKDTDELVVMLNTNDVQNLKSAYPNYFADSTLFLKLLDSISNSV